MSKFVHQLQTVIDDLRNSGIDSECEVCISQTRDADAVYIYKVVLSVVFSGADAHHIVIE